MGEVITVTSSSNGYAWLVALSFYATVGLLILGILLAITFYTETREKADKTIQIFIAVCLVSGYAIGWLVLATPFMGESLRTQDDRFHAQAREQARQAQEEYSSARLYLKESTTDPGTWGEIKGSFGGGFLFVSGSIYGKIESGRGITVIYKQPQGLSVDSQHAGKHLTYSAQLTEVIIETIPAGQEPYLAFPDAVIWETAAGTSASKYKIYPWQPHLYLPEGWEIL